MIDPKAVVIPPSYPDRFGLYRFKDGDIQLVRQHACGDWQTIRPGTAEERKFLNERKEK